MAGKASDYSIHKLLPPLNFIGDSGELELVVSHRADIHAIAATLR